MPWIMQMVWFALLFVGLLFALWVGFWLLLVLFAIGVVMVVWTHLKEYLLAKGILNPTPGVPFGQKTSDATSTLIEGEFTRVDVEKDRVE